MAALSRLFSAAIFSALCQWRKSASMSARSLWRQTVHLRAWRERAVVWRRGKGRVRRAVGREAERSGGGVGISIWRSGMAGDSFGAEVSSVIIFLFLFLG